MGIFYTYSIEHYERTVMFIALSNQPLPYAWGALQGIARFLGVPPSGNPEAELWIGAHPAAPSATPRTFPSGATDYPTLADWIATEPERLLGDPTATDLPILLKVLAAASPLSLQVHPNAQQARDGFAGENARGIPLDHPARTYRDAHPKPEIIVAVSDRFDALCGFRPAREVAEFIAAVSDVTGAGERQAIEPLLKILDDPHRIEDAVRWLLGDTPEVRDCVRTLTRITGSPDVYRGPAAATFATIAELADAYPADPGAIIAALMNRVSLRRGECLFAPAGHLHAYLCGVGIELMTASDNVVRGGLTRKNIDRNELTRLLSFDQAPAILCRPEQPRSNVTQYIPAAPFTLTVVDVGVEPTELTLEGVGLLLAEAGPVTIRSASSTAIVLRGDALFIPVSDQTFTLTGHGRVWIAATTDTTLTRTR